MRVLTFESEDKQTYTIEDISTEDALVKLNEDHGWIEVIDAYSKHNRVRAYFDIDVYNTSDPLQQVLAEINKIFNCGDADWAICEGSREGKISYHLLSTRFSITLKQLRDITIALHKKIPAVDYTLLCISATANHELLFFRLPNQSKSVLNKKGSPMRIVQGDLADFIVTNIRGLVEYS